jgi:hypothetical protein
MLTAAKAVLAIWHDVVEGAEREIFDWYDREHHRERLVIDGFLSAQRYSSVDGRSPLLFNRYETSGLEVLTSDAYRQCLASPTEWSLRCQPLFKNMSRTVCLIAGRSGIAQGAFAATFRLPPEAGLKLSKPQFDEFVSHYQPHWGLVGFEFWQAVPDMSNPDSAERRLRGRDDQMIGSAVVVHATTRATLDEVVEDMRGRLSAIAGAGISSGIYQLMFSA